MDVAVAFGFLGNCISLLTRAVQTERASLRQHAEPSPQLPCDAVKRRGLWKVVGRAPNESDQRP